MTGVARPVLTCGAIRHRIVLNGRASATPGVVGRTHCVRTIRDLTRRAFPAVRTRRVRIIDTSVTARLAAPTIMLRAGFSLQMPEFTPGMLFVDKAVPGVLVRKGCIVAGGIINGVAGFAVPETLRTRFRK